MLLFKQPVSLASNASEKHHLLSLAIRCPENFEIPFPKGTEIVNDRSAIRMGANIFIV